MSTSTLSAVDALTGAKVPLSTFSDENGNAVVGHVALTGAPLSPASQSNPIPVADGTLAAAIAALATELAGIATAAGQASTQAMLNNILAKLNSVSIANIVTVQDAAAETSLAALAAISNNTSGLATAAGQASALTQDAAIATAIGGRSDLSWSGSGDGSLVAISKANVTAVEAVVSRLGAKLPVQQTDPLPAGTNAIGAVSVNGVVSVQDSATEAALNSTLKVAQQGPLPSGTNQIGSVGVTGTVSVQDAASEAALATISVNTGGLSTAAGTPADSAWTGSGGSTLIGILKAVYARLGGTLITGIVGPLPTGTNLIGSVSVANLPSTQAVSGNVSVSNWPATQAVSGTVGVTGTVAVQDSAAAASLSNLVAALGGTLSVQQTTPLPAGTSMLGGVQARNGVTVTQTVVNVTANSDTQLLGLNNNRKSCGFFIVTQGIVAYLNFGTAATIANGLPFGQGSQFGYAYTWEGSGVPINTVHMISPSNATVIVWEGV